MAIMETRTRKHFLTSGEVAKILGCSRYWINMMVAKGELDTHRIGGKGWHRVTISSLERYAQTHGININWALLEQ